MKYIELFAGVGGFRYGIENVRPIQQDISQRPDSSNDTENELVEWECVYSNEWDKYANSVYRKHYGECDDRDITTVPTSEIPDHDLLCGGFPCQAFSVAGKRGGFDDTRGTLFFEIARIAQEKRPRLLLLENVKGLLSHDKGRTFRTILATLDELGYDAQWQVLNSKDFGVPQNRERVFIVGHTRGTPRPQVFPITRTNQKTLEYVGGILSEKAKMWLDNGKQHSRNFPQGSRVYKDTGISATLASQAGGLGAKTGLYAVTVDYEDEKRKIGLKPVKEANTLTATSYKGVDAANRNVVIPVLTPDRAEKRQNGRRFKTNGEPAFTLTGQDKHGVYDGMKIRRLTPIECERLQGFPDDFTKYGADGETISDTQRYKMMGNAVTTNVITAIAERLL